MQRFLKFYVATIVAIVLIVAYMFVSINKIQEKLQKNVENIFISEARSLACNIEKSVKTSFPDGLFPYAFSEHDKRTHLEEDLRFFITPLFRYVYVLYRDKNGNYRYFVDGSEGDDKGEFKQKFDVDKTKWDRVYNSGKELIFRQNLDTVRVTLLHPILYNGKTQAIVAIDFSLELPAKVAETIEPFKTLFIYIFIAIGIFVLIVLIQIYTNIKIKKESYTDPLTGAYNRNFLRDFLNRKDINSYAILMVDIDHFKQINDSYGHKVGDFILKEMVRILKQQLRQNDIIVRFGGEEFLIFLKNEHNDEKEILKIAQRLHSSIEKHNFVYKGLVLKVTVSIGINFHPRHFKTQNEAIKHADKLLYAAKRSGRNKIVSDTNEITSSDPAKKSVYETKEALEDGRIECYYQPIYDVKTNEIVKYEALARMVDKEGAVLTPYFFLEDILHTNLYNEITKLIVQNVFKTIARTSNAISLNLNFSDILDDNLFGIIIDEIQKNKELADKLTIELLEYELLENYQLVKKNIEAIRSYGVKIALDDFGSGYSNYAIFKEIKIDIIKIDGTIIKEIDTSEVLFDIARSIVVLADALDIDIVAEFVHSKNVYEKVKELGIRYAQGFYLGKPEPLE